MSQFQKIDLDALAREEEVDLEAAFADLLSLYLEVEARNQANTAGLDLPCHQGCDACCHESVFVTPLEFYFVWDWVQDTYDERERDEIIRRGLEIYRANEPLISKLQEPRPAGEKDHLSIARQIRFRCPLLDDNGACLVYPARELYARLFGCSFNEEGGIYGCDLVGEHLGGKEVTLLRAGAVAKKLAEFPLTNRKQVYPYYIHQLFG